jgi:hypothetical protein
MAALARAVQRFALQHVSLHELTMLEMDCLAEADDQTIYVESGHPHGTLAAVLRRCAMLPVAPLRQSGM